MVPYIRKIIILIFLKFWTNLFNDPLKAIRIAGTQLHTREIKVKSTDNVSKGLTV